MSNVIEKTYFKSEKDKTNLTRSDLFDRIINVKIVTDDGEEFVIRSDYEAVFTKRTINALMNKNYSNNTYIIQKCSVKPNIKVQYHQESAGSATKISLFISNFFLLDNKGRTLMSFTSDYKIKSFSVMLGYFGQFKDLPHDSIVDLFNFDSNIGNGITVLHCSVSYAQTDKLPPDYTIHLNGYVGNIYQSSDAYIAENEEIKFDKDFASSVSIQTIDDFFDFYISRKFLKPESISKKEIKKLKIDETTKRYSKQDGEKYGVRVFSSKTLKQTFLKVIQEKTNKKDSKENLIKSKFKFTGCDKKTVAKTFNYAKKYLGIPFITKQMSNGNVIAFLEEDYKETGKIFDESFKGEVEKIVSKNAPINFYSHVLPAVYNINMDALTTIVCPFYFIVDVFDYFDFNTRYATGSVVSYFAGIDTNSNRFFTLWMDISFATVEDINECTIVCTTDKQKQQKYLETL